MAVTATTNLGATSLTPKATFASNSYLNSATMGRRSIKN